MNINKDRDKDDEYRDNKSQDLNSNAIVINKNEAEQAFTDRLMSMKFSMNVVNYVIVTINLFKQRMIELKKRK